MQYPPDAYAPDGESLWWELDVWPGKPNRKWGAERKIASWLTFNLEVGETFDMPILREALGDGVVPHEAEHLNRRLRKLREDGWEVPTKKDDESIPAGVYRVDAKGWYPGDGIRNKNTTVSQGVRRRVIDRDQRRCVICGVGSGEPYVGEPGSRAVLTVGHRDPVARRGSSTNLNNLQAECKRCNEPVRHTIRSPESLDQVSPDVVNLSHIDAEKLLSWLSAGNRVRDKVDDLYDRSRTLSPGDREKLLTLLERKVGRKKN